MTPLSTPFVVVLGWPRGSTVHNAVVLSLVAHVGFFVAALTLPALRSKAELLPTLDVVLVSPLVDSQPAPAVKQPTPPAPKPPPPEPEPVKEPEGPSVTPEDPPEKPPEKPKPKPKDPEPVKQPDPPKPEPRPTLPPPEADPDPLASHAPDETQEPEAPRGPISAGAGAAFEGMGVEFNWYRDAVIRALYTSWRQPFATGLREALEVRIAFQINRDGSVSGVLIDQPSGNSALDRSAFRAVLEAQLPPLPRNHGKSAQSALFVFHLDPQSP